MVRPSSKRSNKKSDPFYVSTPWLRLRRLALIRDNWCCRHCGISVRGKGKARVDHILARSQYPELELDLDNLQSLCPPCDNRKHIEKKVDRPFTGVDGWPI